MRRILVDQGKDIEDTNIHAVLEQQPNIVYRTRFTMENQIRNTNNKGPTYNMAHQP